MNKKEKLLYRLIRKEVESFDIKLELDDDWASCNVKVVVDLYDLRYHDQMMDLLSLTSKSVIHKALNLFKFSYNVYVDFEITKESTDEVTALLEKQLGLIGLSDELSVEEVRLMSFAAEPVVRFVIKMLNPKLFFYKENDEIILTAKKEMDRFFERSIDVEFKFV